jgi:site-specific recombinase XerD
MSVLFNHACRYELFDRNPIYLVRQSAKRHTYSTLLRSVGTEFKAMQELLRHSSFRSTLDVYTQAVTPAKHAAQAAVMSLVFSSDEDGATRVAG